MKALNQFIIDKGVELTLAHKLILNSELDESDAQSHIDGMFHKNNNSDGTLLYVEDGVKQIIGMNATHLQSNRRLDYLNSIHGRFTHSHLMPVLMKLINQSVPGKLIYYFKDLWNDKLQQMQWALTIKLVSNADVNYNITYFVADIPELQNRESQIGSIVDKRLKLLRIQSLSKREQLVFKGILEGRKRSELADELQISKHTYDVYRRNIREKLQAKSFEQMLGYKDLLL